MLRRFLKAPPSAPALASTEVIFLREPELSLEILEMTLVPPGCQTGYFYVGFGGADFDSTWKDFKDYLRGCDESLHIDHVEVYKDARKGNGWVRVTSLEAFRKVYSKLAILPRFMVLTMLRAVERRRD